MSTIESIVALQRSFFETGATIDIDFRVEALVRLRRAVRRAEPRILEALERYLGK